MIAHTGLNVGSYVKAKNFFQKALKPLGYKMTMDYPKFKAAGFNDGKNTDFWINQPKKAKTQSAHVAFEAKNKKQVDEFYKAAIAAGAKDNGKPGYRVDYWPGYYAAFVRDADKHNIEVVWFDYSKAKKGK